MVILNHHPGRYFRVFICFATGSKWMDGCPFFCETTIPTWENLFFPWRSLMSTYDPLYGCKSRKYSWFWTEGVFGGKGRTPGERWPKCLEWTQWCSSKPLGLQHGLLSRNSFFKTQNFQKWHLFCVEGFPLSKWLEITQIRVTFENFEIWKRNFCSTSHAEEPRA